MKIEDIKAIGKKYINKIKMPKLPKSSEEILNDFSFLRKNPYRNKKFSMFVAEQAQF